MSDGLRTTLPVPTVDWFAYAAQLALDHAAALKRDRPMVVRIDEPDTLAGPDQSDEDVLSGVSGWSTPDASTVLAAFGPANVVRIDERRKP